MLARGRSPLLIATVALLLTALPAPALAGAAESESMAARKLAEKFAPITMLREEQDPPCEISAEQYQPTTVNTVLNNPSVELRRYREGGPPEGELIMKGPSAEDIVGLSDEYHLDLPGDPLGETCVYSRDFRRLKAEGRAPVATYAHIAREPGHEGFALQFWFFWYFNQFNDLHEGDWEGMQLTFGAATPEEALERGEEPGKIIVFQHAGGERAEWTDPKVQKEGVRPIVYPAAGSHATFYDSAVYVQNGQNGSGLGCDNTSAPLRELRPRPVLLPNSPVDRGRFKWLTYFGRWGENEAGYNNGPQGPQTKTVWREPFTWMEQQRSTSPRLPGGSVVGPQVTKAFCGTVAAVSELINLDAKSRPQAIATIAIAAAIILAFVFITKWGPIDLTQLRARRSFGQIVRASQRLYRHHFFTLVAMGLTAIPIVGGISLLADILSTDHTVDKAGNGLNLATGDLLDGLARPMAMAIVSGSIVVFVRMLSEGRKGGFLPAWAGLRQRFWRVAGAQLLATLGVIALAVTIVGLPWAIYKYVAWTFVKQEVLFRDRSFREAFRGSSDLVRGRWWHTVRTAGFLFLVSIVVGPIATFALIFTALPLIWINFLGSLIFALVIPYVAIGETLLYFDLEARAAVEEPKGARSWKVWRPRRFGRVVRRPERRPAPPLQPRPA